MAECDWLILSDHAFIDIQRKVCIIGIFDRIYTKAVPVAHARIGISIKATGDSQETTPFRIEMLGPSGGKIGNLGGHLNLGDSGTIDVALSIGNIVFPEHGLYFVNLYFGDQLVKTASLSVSEPPMKTT